MAETRQRPGAADAGPGPGRGLPAVRLETHVTDILVLGAGGAGLFAALHAAQAAAEGTRITLAVKGLTGKCGCTRMVQGGYNVALGPGDSVERHFMDTIRGGRWLPDQDMAWRLCSTAVERVQELENELGCFFDRGPDGGLHHKAFAGQTADRTVHKGDLTGIEIINRLMEKVRVLPVERLEEHRALGLVPDASGRRLAAVLMVDMRSGAFLLVRARAVLLATGGGPTMYRYNTPSGDKACDGLAMALRAGLALRDMEMVQFHPTGLLAGPDTRMNGTVLEEGLRGAGGHLLDGQGRRFMADYDPRAERATRDVVSRAIYAEMRAGRTTPGGGVWLSMAHLGPDRVRAMFPGMVARCADCGFDLAAGRVEVVPTAHYMMGGVVADPDTRTALAGLYVAGEDAGGTHGANRLGGNGVANSTVFGGIAGEVMARDLPDLPLATPDSAVLEAELARALAPFGARPGRVAPLREALREAMWEDAGVIREAAGLGRGLSRLGEIAAEHAGTGLPDAGRAFNLAWHDWLNLASQLEVSAAIVLAATARDNSRGAHYREDFPDEGELAGSWFTVVRRAAAAPREAGTEGGRAGAGAGELAGELAGAGAGEVVAAGTGGVGRLALEVTRRPVAFTIVRPGETLLPEDAPESLVSG